MASVFKPEGSKKYKVVYTDENRRRRKKTAYTDKRESERLASQLEETARKVRDGLISRGELNMVSQQHQALDEHLARFHQFLLDADKTLKFADLAQRRLRKLFRIARRRDSARSPWRESNPRWPNSGSMGVVSRR